MDTNDTCMGKIPASAFKDNFMVEVKNRYEILAEENDTQCDTIEQKITCDYSRLKDSITTTVKNLNYKRPGNKKPWITKDILDQMTERKKKKNTPEYKAISRQIQRNCEAAHEKWLEERCTEIESSNNLGRSKQMHEEIKRITGKKRTNTPSLSIRDKNGKLLHDKEKILERWKEYIGELFDDNRPEKPKIENLEGPPILKTEVESALKRMKNGKAAGEDEITAEMLKALHEFGIEKLTTLFNNIYDTGFLPEEMLSSTFITLPKKPKASECGDYRTLSLMSHVTKLLLCVIKARIQKKIDVEVGETQFGFRKESGTREGIFSLNGITKNILMSRKTFTSVS